MVGVAHTSYYYMYFVQNLSLGDNEDGYTIPFREQSYVEHVAESMMLVKGNPS